MIVLGIESSCDETAAAVFDGKKVLSDIVSTQTDIHNKYGGIVPELAARRHLEMIVPVVHEALQAAGVSINAIDGVAVTQGPGLIGALLVGVSFSKALAYAKKLPLVGVNHIEGHITAVLLEEEVTFPYLGLIVSGGHTSLYIVNGIG
ncbi:MAG: tRNA (adenosine(37)-N6)-threonylcarbamoyltransferase complex transferase subunit TsaD, partial [Deltaproteobacteria bacterium]